VLLGLGEALSAAADGEFGPALATCGQLDPIRKTINKEAHNALRDFCAVRHMETHSSRHACFEMRPASARHLGISELETHCHVNMGKLFYRNLVYTYNKKQ
jgi:hypothetical protein